MVKSFKRGLFFFGGGTALLAFYFFAPQKYYSQVSQIPKVAKEVQRHKIFINVAADINLRYMNGDILEAFKSNKDNLMNEVFFNNDASVSLAQKVKSKKDASIAVTIGRDLAQAAVNNNALSSPKLMFKNRMIVYAPRPQTLRGHHFSRTKKELDEEALKEILLAPEVKRIVISNPKNCAVGKLAVETLQKLNLYRLIEKKLHVVDHIGMVNMILQNQAADLGFTSESLVYAKKDRPSQKGQQAQSRFDGVYFAPLAAKLAVPFEYYLIVLKVDSEEKNKLAVNFEQFLNSPEIKKIYTQYGFSL